MSKKVVDPDLYDKLNEPFSSEEKGSRMIQGFWNELRALRKKYKIPNIVCIYSYTFKDHNDKVMVTANYGNCGDSKVVLPLLKLAYERQYQQESRMTEVDLHDSLVLLLATCGWGSIKNAREYVKAGNVKINDKVVTGDCEVPEGAKLSVWNPETGEWHDIQKDQK